ncbi:MAG: hypothetical protein HOP12_08385 [Candidatus Eisenbacteria bacterium]|uniref:Porin n=1 Tax=Eiseniibacteriota bacterium TaxID=2212470 RepID=A0A849SS22_UNCEI|nr:hypothetical protein [Candidatus Eisenbacteria bacterium]
MRRIIPITGLAVLIVFGVAPTTRAGVTNPDVSVIGQPFMRWTDDPSDPGARRFVLDPGETELMLDAPLNPYARGSFVLTFAEDEVGVEEGFFLLQRGLPLGLQLKGGKYRIGFGRLNPQHPHTYPFADRFGVLAAYLPGEESLNETGVQLSGRIPAPGDIAFTASVDALRGDSFRITRDPSGAPNDPLASDPEGGDRAGEPRAAMLGRLTAFVPSGERSGVELGVSALQGTSNVAAQARTVVIGGDVKAKLWTGPSAYVLVQGEVLSLMREDAAWDEPEARFTRRASEGTGGYLYADYNWATRYDIGASYERWQQPDADQNWNASLGAFAGLALLEETTAFRIDWRSLKPARPAGASEDPKSIQQLTVRVVFSMGPHKAHQF